MQAILARFATQPGLAFAALHGNSRRFFFGAETRLDVGQLHQQALLIGPAARLTQLSEQRDEAFLRVFFRPGVFPLFISGIRGLPDRFFVTGRVRRFISCREIFRHAGCDARRRHEPCQHVEKPLHILHIGIQCQRCPDDSARCQLLHQRRSAQLAGAHGDIFTVQRGGNIGDVMFVHRERGDCCTRAGA